MDSYIGEFKERIRKKKIKIAVVGLGYVGLPLAIEFAKKGFSVSGIDVDKDRIERIKKNETYITDISGEELKKARANRKFNAEDNFSSLKKTDVVFVCVPTPLKKKYHPDISFIRKAIKSIAANIKTGALVILESTTYPGTTQEVILPMFQARGLKHARDFYLCFSPERIDPGNSRYPVSKIPKIIGGINREAAYLGKLAYEAIIDKVIIVSDTRIAEAAKLLENTFRIVNIALIDEMAMMAHKMGMDIWEIIEAARTKPFGFMPFYPGPGVGGHCIPKDPLYLYWKARHFGFKSRFIKLASQVINQMPAYVADRVRNALKERKKDINKCRVLVLGVTYKRDVKDLRKSPALDIIGILQDAKAHVSYYDPLIPYLKFADIALKPIELNSANLKKFDCIIVATDHSGIDYRFILNNARLIFDTRNVYKNIADKKIIRL